MIKADDGMNLIDGLVHLIVVECDS